jgi:acylphosphatase
VKAVRVVVSGHVQGVGFRAAAQRRASLLGVAGWVKNLPDGSVEMHAEGDDENVGEFLSWCREGPSAARVDEMSVEDTFAEDPSGFVRR